MREEPVPAAFAWEWQQQGLCRQTNPEIFFHPDGERGPSASAREARAVMICQACPVIVECREHALRFREPYGVWGGMSEKDRENHYAAVNRRAALERLVAQEGEPA